MDSDAEADATTSTTPVICICKENGFPVSDHGGRGPCLYCVSLKELLRKTAVAFFSPECRGIINLMVDKPGWKVTEKDLLTRFYNYDLESSTKFTINKALCTLRTHWHKLKKADLIMDDSDRLTFQQLHLPYNPTTGTTELPLATLSINPDAPAHVAFKIMKITEQLEEKAQSQRRSLKYRPMDIEYQCTRPECGLKYPIYRMKDYLFRKNDKWLLLCTKCGGVLDDAQVDTDVENYDKPYEKFMEFTKEIRDLVRKVWDNKPTLPKRKMVNCKVIVHGQWTGEWKKMDCNAPGTTVKIIDDEELEHTKKPKPYPYWLI